MTKKSLGSPEGSITLCISLTSIFHHRYGKSHYSTVTTRTGEMRLLSLKKRRLLGPCGSWVAFVYQEIGKILPLGGKLARPWKQVFGKALSAGRYVEGLARRGTLLLAFKVFRMNALRSESWQCFGEESRISQLVTSKRLRDDLICVTSRTAHLATTEPVYDTRFFTRRSGPSSRNVKTGQ